MIPAREWFRNSSRRRPRSVAFAIGCLASVILLFLGEGTARVLGLGLDPPLRLRGGCRGATGIEGVWSRPDCQEDFSRFEQGKPLFRVRVSTDSSGRRVIPGQVTGASSQVVFFGCSYTWGWGLEGEQTLPAVFQSERPDVSVWNLAMSGLGPHDALVQMNQAEFTLRGIDRHKPTRGVFVLISDHVARVAGDAYYVRTWGGTHPRFVLETDGSLTQRGTFVQDPLRRWVSRFQTRSQLLRALAPRLQFDSDAYRVDLTVAVLRELRRRFVEVFPGGDLTVVLFPDRTPVEAAAIATAGRAQGLRILDYSGEPRKDLSPLDTHPDAATVARTARALALDLLPLPADAHP